MPTPAEAATMHIAAQNILDNQLDFETAIRPAIESVSASAADTWWSARLSVWPIGSAFSHAFVARAITKINQAGATEWDGVALADSAGAEAYEQYLAHTQAVDQAACEEALPELLNLGGTFPAALPYFQTQWEALDDFNRAHPERVARRSKVAGTVLDKMSATDLLIWPLPGNAGGNTMGIIIGETLRLCLREGGLPDAAILGQELRNNVTLFGGVTRLSSEPLHHAMLGRTVAQKSHKQRREGGMMPDLRPIGGWTYIFHKYLTDGELASGGYEMGQALREDFPSEAIANVRQIGHCAAQWPLRPHEHPDRPEANGQQTAAWFQSHGVQLIEGAFRTIDYQLLRGIDVAEHTIFRNAASRSALEAISNEIHDYRPE